MIAAVMIWLSTYGVSLNDMREIEHNNGNSATLPPNQNAVQAVILAHPYASGWRAFFSIIYIGFWLSGNAKPDPSEYKSYYHWRLMLDAITACGFGSLVASFFAIKWRKLTNYWAIVWRLYVTSMIATVVFSTLSDSNSFWYAVGSSMAHGLLTALAGTSLFYWRNNFTGFVFYFFTVGVAIDVIRRVFVG